MPTLTVRKHQCIFADNRVHTWYTVSDGRNEGSGRSEPAAYADFLKNKENADHADCAG